MTSRFLIGLSIGSGREGVDVALIRLSGLGLSSVPHIEKHVRIPFLAHVRESLKHGPAHTREVADALSSAVRQILAKTGIDLRAVQLIGLQTPAHFDTLSEYLAESTGVTVWSRFPARDIAAGGVGWPFTVMSDYLFAKSPEVDRLLIHLGFKASVLSIRARAKLSELVAFDAGPGCQLLDDLIRTGTNERETLDPGGTRAVQGRCVEDLANDWLTQPFFTRKPPKMLSAEFRGDFLSRAVEAAKQHNASLSDLLCSATHFIARCIGLSCQAYLPAKRVAATNGRSRPPGVRSHRGCRGRAGRVNPRWCGGELATVDGGQRRETSGGIHTGRPAKLGRRDPLGRRTNGRLFANHKSRVSSVGNGEVNSNR
jgi:anhydro-N-acetylmuramic acid kinase